MNLSYDQACRGRLPNKTPCEVYCHTLTDDSILSPELREKGFQTMTLFGLDAPWNLFARDNRTMRKHAEKKFIESMNQWLDEPLEDCLAVARDGSLCIESKSPGRYRGRAGDVLTVTSSRTRQLFLLPSAKNKSAPGV